MTILYTHNIRGDLELLPRLYTFIRRLRGEFAEGQTYLVDLGASCVPEVWPCAITGGRSTLIVLDAMGYHAANVEGVLTPASKSKLAEQVSLALVDEITAHEDGAARFVCGHQDTVPGVLTVRIDPADTAHLGNDLLRLAQLQAGQVGIARVAGSMLVHEIHTMPPGTPPEATISGAVDFVRDEARYYEKRQGD